MDTILKQLNFEFDQNIDQKGKCDQKYYCFYTIILILEQVG